MRTFLNFIAAALLVCMAFPLAAAGQGAEKVVRYSQFGAVGDGVADDFEAIVKAHDQANKDGLPVEADPGATYYIGGAAKTATIQTNTDWKDAKFIIDDTKVEKRGLHVFNISSKLPAIPIKTVKTLKKNQQKLDLTLPQNALVTVVDKTVKRYIRYGVNQNNGTDQTEVFVVDPNGNVDPNTPLIWDYETVSSMTAYPIPADRLVVRGGRFTTTANQEESKYAYYARGIGIRRSNTVVDGVRHEITGELDHGAPYGGFLAVGNCANVTIQNCLLSGHKTYKTTLKTGISNMGSYDLNVNRAANVTFKNCKQLNDILDRTLWGIFGSNLSKNIVFDTVEFSRFDAHMGVANATIRNSVLGHAGINLIGSGVFLVENTKAQGRSFISLRSDYGSTFEGEVIIRNCEYLPHGGTTSDAVVIGGSNSGQHDFGYTCYMPRKITIDGLVIDDTNTPKNYQGPKLFSPFSPKHTSDDYEQPYPPVITEEVEIRNLTIKSGKPWIISTNPFLFRNVKVTETK